MVLNAQLGRSLQMGGAAMHLTKITTHRLDQLVAGEIDVPSPRRSSEARTTESPASSCAVCQCSVATGSFAALPGWLMARAVDQQPLAIQRLLYEVSHVLLAERAEVVVVRLEATNRSWSRYGAPASAWDGRIHQESDNAVGFEHLEVARTAAPETRRAAIRAVPPIRPVPEETQ